MACGPASKGRRKAGIRPPLYEDGHVIIALVGEPLHLGVDPRGNVELLGTEEPV
jgi:hypothetical protein